MALYAWWITTERKVFLPATEYLPFGKHHHNLSHGIRLWTLLALVQVYTRHTVRHLATVLLLPPGKLKSRHIVSADSVHGSMELARRASLCNESFSLKSWACTSQNKLFTIETETSACRRRRLSPAHIVVEMFYAVNWHWYWKLLHDTRAFLLQRVDQFVVAGPTYIKLQFRHFRDCNAVHDDYIQSRLPKTLLSPSPWTSFVVFFMRRFLSPFRHPIRTQMKRKAVSGKKAFFTFACSQSVPPSPTCVLR